MRAAQVTWGLQRYTTRRCPREHCPWHCNTIFYWVKMYYEKLRMDINDTTTDSSSETFDWNWAKYIRDLLHLYRAKDAWSQLLTSSDGGNSAESRTDSQYRGRWSKKENGILSIFWHHKKFQRLARHSLVSRHTRRFTPQHRRTCD